MSAPLRSALLALLATPLLALAAPPQAATEHVQARLVSSQAAVAPGQRFTVALEQDIKAHWHTYWLNPGDSGQATSIDWQGAQAGPIQWPTPSIQAIGPIVNYGYEGKPALLVDVTVPVRDLNRDLDWNLPEDDATTIAGLVIARAGAIPDAGQRFAFFGFTFDFNLCCVCSLFKTVIQS